MHEFQKERQTVFHAMLLCLSLFPSKQCIIKQLLDSVFVICGIIKNEVSPEERLGWLQYLVFLRGILQTLVYKKGMPTKKEHLSRLTPID